MVDGDVCNSSPVKECHVWDVDNENGAYVNASPNVYPVCIGNGATMRFNDNTLFNCVPPRRKIIPMKAPGGSNGSMAPTMLQVILCHRM